MSADAAMTCLVRRSNPFSRDAAADFVEIVTDEGAGPGPETVQRSAFTRCLRVIDDLIDSASDDRPSQRVGRTVLVGAPRAGYGKTHLVGRLAAARKDSVTLIPLSFDLGEGIGWRHTLRRLVKYLESTSVEAHFGSGASSASASLWQEAGRRLFAEAIIALADGGEAAEDLSVPTVDAATLRADAARDLAPDSTAEVREWVMENCYRLTELAGPTLIDRWAIEPHSLPTWIEAFRRSALEDADADGQATILRSLLRGDDGSGDDGESLARARVGELLRMVSTCRPLVLVIDHLDGFFGRSDFAMPMANLVVALQTLLPRGVTLLCLNRDIWDSVFAGHLPSAISDRLDGEPAALGNLTIEQALALVRHRLDNAGVEGDEAEAFVEGLSRSEGWSSDDHEGRVAGLYPRSVLRRAAAAWELMLDRKESTDAGAEPEPAPAATSAPDDTSKAPEPEAARPLPSPSPSPRETSMPPVISPPVAVARPPVAEAATPSPPHSPTQLDHLVEEIRSGGALAVSERPAPGDAVAATVAPSPRVNGHAPSPSATASNVAGVSAEEGELRRRVAAWRASGPGLPWCSEKIERLIEAVGDRFPAVAQRRLQTGGQSFLRWTVRDRPVLLGFSPAADSAFWNRLMQRAEAYGDDAKVVSFCAIHAGDTEAPRRDLEQLAAGGANHEEGAVATLAGRSLLDVIDLEDDDLALLYAADDMILAARQPSSEQPESSKRIVRFVARRMDPFWRRLTRRIDA